MNRHFAEATTSVAFQLSLSKRQCNSLLRLAEHEAGGHDLQSGLDRLWILSVDGLRGLDRRGLVFWNYKPDGTANGFGGMTEAGRLTAKLLTEAGLTIENTNTALVLRRMEQRSTN